MSKAKMKASLVALKQVLKDDITLAKCRKVEKDVREQVRYLKDGLTIEKANPGFKRTAIYGLDLHKARVRKGYFIDDPLKEIKAIDRMLEMYHEQFTRTDLVYLSRRRKKAIQNINNPSPYYRVCRERRGGFLAQHEKDAIQTHKIIDNIYKILEDFDKGDRTWKINTEPK